MVARMGGKAIGERTGGEAAAWRASNAEPEAAGCSAVILMSAAIVCQPRSVDICCPATLTSSTTCKAQFINKFMKRI